MQKKLRRKVTCPNRRAHEKRDREKILFVYEENSKPEGTFLVFCHICKAWYEIRFNNSSPIVVRMPKGYFFEFALTPSLVME